MMIWPTAISATERLLLCVSLKTAMPIDADAEGANGEERVGGLEHVRGNPGLRANA